MIPALGRLLVLAALFFASAGFVLGGFAGFRHNDAAWRWARRAAYAFSGAMIAANVLMVYALWVRDFSVSYVAEVGAHATPTLYVLPSLWASLNGSILFWGAVLAIYVIGCLVSIGDKHRAYMPWVLHVLMGICIFFCFLVASVANPFAPVSPVPLDGPGPNPLLQNHWLMAVHPPMLYLGYVGMSVPFSLICGALLAGRLDAEWIRPIRTWMLIPWAFLTIGIVLGGWWSYAVLGWGGAWAWDPVENASFHPWLTGTAFLHSAMVLERRGIQRDWTLVLGLSTFLLTLLGTFMTRSGVFNSVHSFTESDIGHVFLAFIAVCLTYSVVLLAFRTHKLDEASDRLAGSLGIDRRAGRTPRLLSRETAILAQNALFATFTFMVLLGTLYPILAEALQGRRLSVGEPYFDRWALPLGLGIVFLMGVGPALPWGRVAPRAAAKRLAPPVLCGALFAILFAVGGFTKVYTVLAMFLIGFTAWANVGEFITPVVQRMRSRQEPLWAAAPAVFTKARRRFGGHIAHFGVLLAVLALALSKGYRTEQDFLLHPGDTAEFHGFDVTFVGSDTLAEPNRTSLRATFDLARQQRELGSYAPRLNHYPGRPEPIYTPDVYTRPTFDLYFSLIEPPMGDAPAVLRLIHQPYQMWLWWSAPVIGLGTLISLWPRRRRSAAREPAPEAA